MEGVDTPLYSLIHLYPSVNHKKSFLDHDLMHTAHNFPHQKMHHLYYNIF